MPAVSKKQFKLMKMVETGQTTLPGMSKKEAKEYTKSNVGRKRFSRLKEKIGK
jgi:hypothetical protein